MFHPYVPGSYSPFGPSPSASPGRSSPAFFLNRGSPGRGPGSLTPASPSEHADRERRESLHTPQDVDSDESDSGHESVYSASPVASEYGGKGKTVEFVTTGLDRGSERRDVGADCKGSESRSSRRSSVGEAYYTDEEDWRLYFEYASPTEPLHPASPPPPEFPFHSIPNASSSPLLNSLFAQAGSHPDPVAAFYTSRPIFRPPTSMNRSYGTLGAHPFHRAPMADWYGDGLDPPTPDELDSPSGQRLERGSGSTWDAIMDSFFTLCCCARDRDNY